MITYSDLKNTYHAEKQTASSLSKINSDFYYDAQKLLTQIGDLHREHIINLLSEIYEMRKNKILLSAARSHKPENLIPVEDEFYKEITDRLDKFRERLLRAQTETKEKEGVKEENKKEEQKPKEKKTETEKIKVRIIKNIPAIIGSDLMHYELKENDEIELPAIDAKILIENGIAIRI